MITKKDIEAEFDEKFKGWILQDDQESYRSFDILKSFAVSIPLSLLESLEKDVKEIQKESWDDEISFEDVLSLIKQYKEQLK